MKITIVGGGSYSWVPMLVKHFLDNDFFAGQTICLMDIDAEALQDLYDLCCFYNADSGNRMVFIRTMDMMQALQGASYVIVAIAHGGLEAELEDHRLARKHGFYNIKGCEVGIAGCSRTLRHVPEMVRIARLMEQHCPQAMLLNVTNPLTATTRAVNKYTSIPTVGFCHGVVNHLQMLFPYIGADGWDDIEFAVAGIDHCSWLLEVKYRGMDALQLMKDQGLIEAAKSGITMATFDDPFAGRENQRLRFLLWDIIGYLPAISDEHCCEFFGQFAGTAEVREHYGITYDRVVERQNASGRARGKVKAELSGELKREGKESTEFIDKFIAALNGGEAFIDVMNAPNLGQIANLPMGMVVEGKYLIDAAGIHPIQSGGLPPILESIVRPIGIRQEMYMEAAMENNPGKLRSALSMDPLVNDFRSIDAICDDLIRYNRQFWN